MGDFVSAPAPTSGGFCKEEHLGTLLIVEIFGIVKENGDYGEQDVIMGNVHVLDGPMAGHCYDEQTIYGRRLVGQARATLNAGANRMLGRLARGQAKKGQPPWILAEPSADDLALAERWSQTENAAGNTANGQAPAASSAPPSQPQTSQPQTGQPSTSQPSTAAPIAVAPTAQSEPPF